MVEPNARWEKGLWPILRRPYVWPVLVAAIVVLAFVLSRPDLYRMRYSRARLGVTQETVGGGFGDSASEMRAVEEKGIPELAAGAPVSSVQSVLVQRKVISTATLEIRVKTASRAADDLAGLAIGTGGFVQSSSVAETDGGGHTAEMVLRIPAAKLEAYLGAAGRLGEVRRKEVSGQDVTEDYVDHQARLRAWTAEEGQILTIMAQAKTVAEILAIRETLRQVRETIEQIQGKLKYYDYNVALATVNISLYEGTRPAATPWILEELSQLGRALYGSIRALIHLLLTLIPWGLAGWGIWSISRRAIGRPRP